MPYATGSEMLERYDARLLGDLVSDNGVAVSAGALPGHPNLVAVLNDASAAIDAAVFVGNRYTPSQMSNLSASAAAFVRRLTCDLALIYIKRRRGRFDSDKDAALLKEVNASLDALRSGDDVLVSEQDNDPGPQLEGTEMVTVVRPRSLLNQIQNYYPDGHPRRNNCGG